MSKALVGIVMGSDSDLPVLQQTTKTLKELGIPYELTIASAHRTPKQVEAYLERVEACGLEVLIAGAGGAAHLAGVLAARTILPVIGVPIQTKALGGLDSLFSIVQMPSGVPVATVGINGAQNAAILAAQILALKYPVVYRALKKLKFEMEQAVQVKAQKLNELGIDAYLKGHLSE